MMRLLRHSHNTLTSSSHPLSAQAAKELWACAVHSSPFWTRGANRGRRRKASQARSATSPQLSVRHLEAMLEMSKTTVFYGVVVASLSPASLLSVESR
jgi:hypothetical protein